MVKKYILQLLNFFYPLVKKIMPFQVYAYLSVGAANTILNIALFVVCYLALSPTWPAVELATVISFVITVLTGFWLNKNFAFTDAANTAKENKKQFGKYFLVSLQGQFSDYLITKGLIVLLLINPVVAYFLSTFIMLVITFFLQKHYTFRKAKPIIIK
jgi:putative flippase GtrA